MFNIYEFEKRVKGDEDQKVQQLRDIKKSEILKSKIATFNNQYLLGKNDTMSNNYRLRVAQFIKKVRGLYYVNILRRWLLIQFLRMITMTQTEV